MFVHTENGAGELVRPIREHGGRRFATVRTPWGSWVSGEIIECDACADASLRHEAPPSHDCRDFSPR